ncbi:MAG TPA: hypothetical protein VHY09_00950 [Candidatus Methylacidiphilales bacterium]|nr:hypothetical protein [Candidatus Methylacidiphilales bacterium]
MLLVVLAYFFTFTGGLPAVLGLLQVPIDCTKQADDPFQAEFTVSNRTWLPIYDVQVLVHVNEERHSALTASGDSPQDIDCPKIDANDYFTFKPKFFIRIGMMEPLKKGDIVVKASYQSFWLFHYTSASRFETDVDEGGHYTWRHIPLEGIKRLPPSW